MNGARLPAHKAVLASNSPYFMKLIASDTRQSEISVQNPKLDVSALEMLVEFIYTSILRITEGTVASLCYAANLLQMERIERACCKFMEKNLDHQNCISYLHFAEANAYSDLREKCEEYIAQHVVEIAQTPAFRQLSLSELAVVLESKSLAVPSQQALLESLMQWVKHDTASRHKNLYWLLTSTKLPQLTITSDEQLLEMLPNTCMETEYFVNELKARFEKLKLSAHNQAQKSTLPSPDPETHTDQDDQSVTSGELPEAQQQPPKSKLLFAIGGNTKHSTTSSVEVYNASHKEWLPATSLPRKKSHAALVAVGQKLYSIGGFDGTKTLSSVDIYNLQSKTWSEGPSMHTPRSAFGVAAFNNSIYCIGGYNGSKHISSVEILDLRSNTWKRGPELKQARSYVQATAIGGTIYAIGGTDGTSRLASVEKLCVQVGVRKWLQVADLNIPRSRPGVATLNGCLYAVGGYSGNNHLSSVECYDPQINQWTLIESLSTPRNSPGIGVVNGRLIVAGGHNGEKLLKTVEVYDPQQKQWNNMAPMQEARCDFGMTAVVAIRPQVTRTWT